jgi:type IV pilus assembly protein PilA
MSGCLLALLIAVPIFLVLGGILATLAIYGTRKYIANAKTAEARNALAAIGRDAVAAYEREQGGATPHRLCPSASRPVPVSVASVTARKYQSSPAEWQVDAASHAGFACLAFEMDRPQYYQYSYAAHGRGAAGDGIEATATGDLDGNGTTSLFTLTGKVGADGALVIAPSLVERDPTE